MSMSGLTGWQIVKQSWLCHPDWSVETHLGYLEHEEDFNLSTLTGEPAEVVAGWLSQLVRDTQPGLLHPGVVTEHGTVKASTDTAYEMEDGTYVPFQKVHGRPAPAVPLVRLG